MKSLLPSRRVVARGLIFDATIAGAEEAVSYFTSLAPLRCGAMLAAWQCGRTKQSANTIRLARSTDQGASWEVLTARFETTWQGVPGSFLAAEMVECEAGRVLLFATWADRSQPERPLFNPETEGILPTRLLLCESHDAGESWTAWTELDTGELRGCALTGPVLQWEDGTIACAFESFKEFDDPTPARPGAWVCISRDGGRSFTPPHRVAQDPDNAKYFWDQRLAATNANGQFVGMFWTYLPHEKRDANVHFLHSSIDEPSQVQPVETSIQGQIAACGWDNGVVLSFVVDRGQPATMTLWQSADGGRTWPPEARCVVYEHEERAAVTQGRENIDFAQYWEDMGKWSFGHPAMRKLADGWLLAWYAGTPERMSLHWARILTVD